MISQAVKSCTCMGCRIAPLIKFLLLAYIRNNYLSVTFLALLNLPSTLSLAI